MYVNVCDETVTHRYRIELIIRKNDDPIWKDCDKAVERIISFVDADITSTEWYDDEDEFTVEIEYETDAHVQSADPYWDEDGGDPGYEEIEDDMPPEAIESAVRSLGKSKMQILEDELEYF